tara:strand:+ start:3413 stop:3991 length:579 start_codon:yes stop_codon:yes gene_type:complete
MNLQILIQKIVNQIFEKKNCDGESNLEPQLSDIKELRELTSAGIMDCKSALIEANGDIEKAKAILHEKGLASVAKKSSRATEEGIVASYIHAGGRIGSIVEVNCETDFVARTDDFKNLAHDLAMQVAAMSPQFVYLDDDSDSGEGDNEDLCLVEQNFIKDQSIKVKDVVSEVAARVGENIRIKRFSRFSIGE